MAVEMLQVDMKYIFFIKVKVKVKTPKNTPIASSVIPPVLSG